MVDAAREKVWRHPYAAKSGHYLRVVVNDELGFHRDFQFGQPLVVMVGGFFVDSAYEPAQGVLFNDFPPLAQAGPNVDFVPVVQQFLKGVRGAGTQGVVQSQDGVVDVKKDFHIRQWLVRAVRCGVLSAARGLVCQRLGDGFDAGADDEAVCEADDGTPHQAWFFQH